MYLRRAPEKYIAGAALDRAAVEFRYCCYGKYCHYLRGRLVSHPKSQPVLHSRCVV
jgi:hypothetical protein